MHRTVAALLATALLLLSSTTALAQEPSLSPAASLEGRDLYLDMPYNLGGFEPQIVMTRGAEHFASLDPDDPADTETRTALDGLLAATGAEIEDMVSGYALVSQDDFFSFVVGIRIAGAEPGSLKPAYLPILLGDLQDPVPSEARVGGKAVTVVSTLGDADEDVALYVYDAGDTLWMVQGPEDVVEIALEDLP